MPKKSAKLSPPTVITNGSETIRRELLPDEIWRLTDADAQRAIPAIAKQPALVDAIERALAEIATRHELRLGDARARLAELPAESVQLVLTSPPYWNLKKYVGADAQLGDIDDYENFLTELDEIWRECFRLLVPGGRLVVVVGDVCVPRRKFGRHVVFPLHASIQEHCRHLGFDNLNPIIWNKIANAQFEAAGNGGGFLGKPYEPNAVIKNDIEYILFQRKPGGYRQPTIEERVLSLIPAASHREWFQPIWTLGGASTRHHPAPFPLPLAERLVRMFSFVGDTILDPFLGTATTTVAAMKWGRSSIGIEVEPEYVEFALDRIGKAKPKQNRIKWAT